MPELRKTRSWAWVITRRNGTRPRDYAARRGADRPAKNPFAEGNEHLTPAEIFCPRSEEQKPDGPGWQVRVVPNKSRRLRMEGTSARRAGDLRDKDERTAGHET